MNVLIVGATGMLGYSLFKNLQEYSQYNVCGTVRSLSGKEKFFEGDRDSLIQGVDILDSKAIEETFAIVCPDVVINCVGLIKQHSLSKQYIDAVEINSLLPHKLAALCAGYQAKLIHFSTDCVFDGAQGNYTESDLPTARDLYGRSKCMGEVDYSPHLTLRTSIIGHELVSCASLIDWFLSQTEKVRGFSKAIFSGLPTCTIAKLLAEKILPENNLSGLYHLSVDPIDKHSLLQLVAEIYRRKIDIIESQELTVNRSLDSSLLRSKVAFQILTWKELVAQMYADYLKRYKF